MSCGSCGQSSCGGCHSCSGCGSSGCNWGCGCSCAVPAGCNPAVCPTATPCGNVLPANPTPYYVTSPQCQEDHCQQIIKNWYSAAICVNYAFNIPACGATAVLYFSDVRKLVVNSYLWHPTYGYFKVVAFDFATGQVTILNTCEDGNAAAGTSVPACTCFIVSPTPFDTAEIGASCVAIDFTAPAVGDCLDITVTNVNGLEIGGQVAIGSGVYALDAIVSSTVITICNEGLGITPGTPVIALDAQGDYQYCLAVISSSPCTKDIIADGIVLVCKDGTVQPLGGSAAGQLIVLQNAGTDSAAYVDPCTAVDACIEAITDPIIEDVACGPQVIITDIPLESYDVTVTLSDSPVANSGTFATTVDANVITINVPNTCPGVNYLVEAVLSVGCFPRVLYSNSAPNSSYHELEINWDASGGRADGKAVWCDFPGGIFSVPPAAPTNSLIAQFGTIANSIQGYHQSTITQARQVAAGGSTVLELFYRTVVPNVTDPVLSFTLTKIQIKGYVRLTRI